MGFRVKFMEDKFQKFNKRSARKAFWLYLVILLAFGFSLSTLGSLVLAQSPQPLQINIYPSQEKESKPSPPQITVFPPSLTNKEILYLGGVAEPGDTVLVFLQRNKEAITSAQLSVDDNGSWFYTHKEFLSEGEYKIWARVRNIEGVLSEPTEPVVLDVLSAAIEIGSYRISFQSLYTGAIGLLSLLITIFVVVIVILSARIRGKHQRLKKEVWDIHQSVKKGFEILKDDIQKELVVLQKLEKDRTLTSEEKARQAKLLADLDFVANYIEREVVDVEKLV